MIDLKDYVPAQIKFKLPVTVKFPEVIFPDCTCVDDVKKKLSEHFVTIQEKDVIANRIMDDYEISTIRANYGEIAEEQMSDAAHLVPKSIYPEHYTNPLNIVGLCRKCHNKYDNNLTFRQKQKQLIKRVKSFDEYAANRHFHLYELEVKNKSIIYE